MTDYVDTQGTLIKRGDGASPEVFTTISHIDKISPIPIGTGAPLRDRTDLSHTDTRKHTLGLPDMPEIVCEGKYDPKDATHTALITDYTNKTVRNFEIILPSSPTTTYSFSALVMVTIGEVGLDADVPFTLTLKPQSLLTAA